MPFIDLNCDMGESTTLWPYSIEQDKALLGWVSSINIATGYHAGDAYVMHQLVEMAIEKNIAIGVHCAYADTANFGRTYMPLSNQELVDLVSIQTKILQDIVHAHGGKLHHVKPHGALYNASAKDTAIAATIAAAVKDIDPQLKLYGLSGSISISEANKIGIQTKSEVFADRTYQQDGSLTPRTASNAMITDVHISIQQVMQMVQTQKVDTIQGHTIPLKAETICVHSDGVHALALVQLIVQQLVHAGISISYL